MVGERVFCWDRAPPAGPRRVARNRSHLVQLVQQNDGLLLSHGQAWMMRPGRAHVRAPVSRISAVAHAAQEMRTNLRPAYRNAFAQRRLAHPEGHQTKNGPFSFG